MEKQNINSYLPLPNKKIWHSKDIDYFKEYPAPVMENIQRMHFTNINSTITFYGPMLYFIARAIGAEQILEIGTAEAYSAFYLAHAVKDNGVRFGMKDNHYYGIDIVQTNRIRELLLKEDLPATIINFDSMALPGMLKDIKFDLIFQDGAHDTEHVLYELETMYPQLKPNGLWVFHDSAGPAEEAWHKVMKMIQDDKYQFEYIRLLGIYGISLLRKTEGVDPEKRYWS